MLSYVWPIALIVLSNVFYHICTKSAPDQMDPLASLTVTYAVAGAASALLYFLVNKDPDLLREYTHIGWSPFVLGVVIVGLEAGNLYAYKAGWPISAASIVQSAFLAVALLFVGFLVYHEALTFNKVFGALVCLLGLYFINK